MKVRANTSVQAASVAPPKKTDVEDGIVKIVNALTGAKKSKKDLKAAKVTEDILFAALVFKALEDIDKDTSVRLLGELKALFDQNTRENDTQPLFRAIDTILDRAVSEREISQQDADEIVASSFGRAQLDKSKSLLSRRARGSGIEEVMAVITKNNEATSKAISSFEKRLVDKPTLSKGTSKAQRRELDKVLSSMKSDNTSSTTDPGKTEETSATNPGVGTPETDKKAELPSPENMGSGPTDFVYLPESSKDGHGLFILPARFSPIISGVKIFSEFDDLIEVLKPRGKGADGRWYFSSKDHGRHLGSNRK